jgi:hypothetical protein
VRLNAVSTAVDMSPPRVALQEAIRVGRLRRPTGVLVAAAGSDWSKGISVSVHHVYSPPGAWRAGSTNLALRHAARTDPDAACAAPSARQLQLLRACGTRPLSATPSNQEVYMALALGGHLRSNGPPGWIVLGRAFDKLLVLEQGWLAGRRRSDR